MDSLKLVRFCVKILTELCLKWTVAKITYANMKSNKLEEKHMEKDNELVKQMIVNTNELEETKEWKSKFE